MAQQAKMMKRPGDPRREKSKSKTWSWLFISLSLLAIAGFSNQEFERQDLAGRIKGLPALIEKVQQLPHMRFDYYGNGVYIDNCSDPVGFVQFLVRKLGHMLLYSCLSLGLLFSQAREGKPSPQSFGLAAFMVLLAAALDEFHQSFVMGRSGSVKDIGIDMSAYLLTAITMYLYKKRRESN